MRSSIELDIAVGISKRRWVLDVLCELHDRKGARTVELLHALDVTRDGLRRALDAALADGLVQRNPGHGHPLRPEWLLTTEGVRLASAATRLRRNEARLGIDHGDLGRWGLPTSVVISDGAAHFNDMIRALPEITPRALSLCLVRLDALTIVQRRLVDGRPPRSTYRLTPLGTRLIAA